MANIFSDNFYEKRKTRDFCIVSRSVTLSSILSLIGLTWAFGFRICPNPATVQLAKANGYDTVFLELEHSVRAKRDANSLCTTALLAGVTPFVRVPYQRGDGYVQGILDGSAMGVVFPHISTAGT
jgi:2-keto-3-deoxy-L-rhamnonate aldolase RhmA